MASNFFRLNSLRGRLMLLVALAVLPSALMTIYSGWKDRQEAVKSAEQNLQRLTNLAAANEAQSLEAARHLLSNLSDNPDLLGPPTTCSALLRTILRKNPTYANLGLIQLNGDITCSAIPSSRPINLADRQHFKRAIAERRFIAGDYVFGRLIQKHTINLTYPVIGENGEVIAVVFAALDLFSLDKFINAIDLPAGSVLITADSEGNIISRRPNPSEWFGEKVAPSMAQAMSRKERRPLVLRSTDGVERLHTFARIGTPDVSDFVVTIGLPSRDIVAPAQRDQIAALLALAAATILALFATWLVGNAMIVRRMQLLVDTARKISSGKLDARTGLQYGREEISYLAQALDDMAASLQRKDAERDKAEQELRAADQRKDEFLAMLAHELRNPLAPISSAAQILKLVEIDEPRLRQTSDIITRQVEHMTGLIDDLLDVSRVTRGLITISRETLDLRQVAGGAVEQVRSLIDTRHHQLTVSMPPEPACVSGDAMRLTQVLTNLLNNAAKYTPEGGTISLAIAVHAHEVTVTVTDNGVGISPRLLPHIFKLFSQAERTPDRTQGGLGLGLALVKNLVELHGGSVVAHSQGAHRGSEFIVRLPRLKVGMDTDTDHDGATAQTPQEHARRPSAGAGHGTQLMVVDDNVDAADSVAALLETLGYKVAVEYDSPRALARARIEAPQILLLDIGLPDMDGYELARQLRASPATARASLIALTGYGKAEDRARSREAGFDYHLVKPADPKELSALLARLSATLHAGTNPA